MRLADYLGAHVRDLLTQPPFSGWEVTRSIEEDLPKKEVRYLFEARGVEVLCDESERICAIFLRRGDGEALGEVAFSLSRRQVLDRYGVPSESGGPVRIRSSAPTGPGTGFVFRRGGCTFNTDVTATRST
jgi:hypothetical protein